MLPGRAESAEIGMDLDEEFEDVEELTFLVGECGLGFQTPEKACGYLEDGYEELRKDAAACSGGSVVVDDVQLVKVENEDGQEDAYLHFRRHGRSMAWYMEDDRLHASEESRRCLDEWLAPIDAALDRWRTTQLPDDFPFDYSSDSLAALERLVLDRFDGPAALAAADGDEFLAGAVRYVGETALRLWPCRWTYRHSDRRSSRLAALPWGRSALRTAPNSPYADRPRQAHPGGDQMVPSRRPPAAVRSATVRPRRRPGREP